MTKAIALLVLLLVLFDLSSRPVPHTNGGRGPGSFPALNDPAPDLDSFSEPDIAAAVLKRHAQALIEVCSQDLGDIAGSDHRPLQARSGQWINRYQTEFRRQKQLVDDADIAHGLLILYKISERPGEFLDCYLRLLGASPEHPVIWRWAGTALSYGQACGRTEEVLDALRHIARFDQD